MVLLSQIAGLGVAAVCLVAIARAVEPELRTAYVSVVAVPVVVAAALGIPALRTGIDQLWDARDRNRELSSEQAQVQGGAIHGARTDFIDWVRGQLGDGDTYHLPKVRGGQPAATRSAIFQWTTFQLTPHLLVPPKDADWLVLYGRRPGTGYAETRFGSPRRFDEGFYLLRRRDEG